LLVTLARERLLGVGIVLGWDFSADDVLRRRSPATPSPPINAADAAQGSFCIDSCCPETAIPKLIFGPDDRFGEGIVVMQNNSRLTCMGEFEATDVRIAGSNTTVADLVAEVKEQRAADSAKDVKISELQADKVAKDAKIAIL
jgi:hypothetical protein